MLTPYQRPQFLSKIFTDASGRQFRLTFFVAMVDGELKGHLVSAEFLQKTSAAALPGEVSIFSNLCLPESCHNKIPETLYAPAFAPVVSPFFSQLEFLIHSQPTRAPSRS